LATANLLLGSGLLLHDQRSSRSGGDLAFELTHLLGEYIVLVFVRLVIGIEAAVVSLGILEQNRGLLLCIFATLQLILQRVNSALEINHGFLDDFRSSLNIAMFMTEKKLKGLRVV